jgi:hypothetical protein
MSVVTLSALHFKRILRFVGRYPGQEYIAGSSKIPTIIYYDKSGNVKAVGAEALLEQTVEEAEDEEWMKVQWYEDNNVH